MKIKLPAIDIYIILKEKKYFLDSDLWETEINSRGYFTYLDTSEKYDKILNIGIFSYNPHATLYHEIKIHKIMGANIKDSKIGFYEIEQDGEMYFNEILPDMIEKIYNKETHPEYFI